MKLLLDENLPQQLRHELPGHDVFTVAYMGWRGIRNGALMVAAAQAGFDAFTTNDRGLEFEQNLATLPLSIVVLLVRANTLEVIRPLLPSLRSVLALLKPHTLVKVS